MKESNFMRNRYEKHHYLIWKYIWISLGVFVVSVFMSWISCVLLRGLAGNSDWAGVIANLSNGLIAAIAVGLVLYQLKGSELERKRQNNIEEASFLLEYNQSFIQDPNMSEVEELLESQAFYGRTEDIITSTTRQKVINYLVYLEGLAPLVLNDILELEHIDDLMAYRFFLVVNNPEVQEKELKPFAGDYRGCFKLYSKWANYRKNKGYTIHLEETALDKWEDFNQYASL